MPAEGTSKTKPVTETVPFQFVPQGDTISLETVVNILINKGICTTSEIFMLEGQVREKKSAEQAAEYQRIRQQSRSPVRSTRHKRLKRLFAKFKWSRRLGEKLFGWRWKKVKHTHAAFPNNLAE